MSQKIKKREGNLEDVGQSRKDCFVLPAAEVYFYVVVWTGGILYSAYATYRSSEEHGSSLKRYFTEGWKSIGRKKDVSDYEWSFWVWWFSRHIFPWYLGHVFLARIFNRFFYTVRPWIFTCYALVALLSILGFKALSFLLLQCVVVYLAGALFKSVISIWIISLALLSTLNINLTVEWMKTFDSDPDKKLYFLVTGVLAMTNIRYISFCIEMVQQSRNGHSQHFSLAAMMTYILYLPLFFTGPLITYDQFRSQFYRDRQESTKMQMLRTGYELLRVLFWAFFIEVTLHFIYFSSLQYHENILNSMPLWALAGVGMLNGQFFMLRYVVMFGLPRVCSKMDGLQVAAGPKCISTITQYSQMWKSFDQGLYSFLKRYIYIPLGGSRSGILRQLLASLSTFIFIFVWHGTEYYIFYWCLLNFIGISLEVVGRKLMNAAPLRKLKQHLSDRMYLRVVSLLVAPLYAMSVIAIFIFFGGVNTGLIFYRRLIIEGFPVSTFTTLFFLYCAVQTSFAVGTWEKKRKEKQN